MACAAIGICPRTYLSSLFSGYTSGVSNDCFSSRDACLCGRRGFFGKFGSFSSPKGFHLRASAASSGCRRPTYLLAYARVGGCQKKLYFRPESPHGNLYGSTAQISPRMSAKRGRGLKRTLSASNQVCCAVAGDSQLRWNYQNSFGNMSSKATPLAARKKFRCWNTEGDAGEPPPSDNAALEALEQAIEFQVKQETRLFFGGPARGDLAEVEAFCRLYRHAEQLHAAVMNALRAHSTTANESKKDLGPYSGDALLVEEKVASGLAHLMSILNEGKEDVLGVRTLGRTEKVSPDDLPPLAELRKGLRACCSTLEQALESLFPSESQQGLAARERLLKLKNTCLDAGFPRPEGIPSSAEIPNLAPVRLRPSKSARTLYKDENVAFWRGGHITEAGLSWLVEKGFKTIVDLREGSAQPIARSALPEAVASGKLKVARIPIERGSAPSKEQVEEFARLVADPDNKPLYLHTRAGVGRASAMVSRWREVVLRKQLEAGAAKGGSAETITGDLELLSVDDAVRISQEDALTLENAIKRSKNGPLSVPEKGSNGGITGSADSDDAYLSGHEELTPAGVLQDGQANPNGSVLRVQCDIQRFDVTKNAFEAQRPIRNVLNRKAMSKFMKRRKVPAIFFSNRIDKPIFNSSAPSSGLGLLNGNISGPANRWVSSSRGIPMTDGGEASKRPQPADVSIGPVNGSSDKPIVRTNGNSRLESVNGSAEGLERNEAQSDEESKGLEKPGIEDNGSFYKPPEKRPSEEVDEPVSVDGDMCASTTGVVRLQSRKKAEMFLVRTDGYSCTRERVKESTLAFTHPSTQQQMLMWKTPPRTVLLLKKLGSELTKETQEVASFLYHQEGMNVMVEPDVHDSLARLPGFGFIQTFYNQDKSELHERVDFVVCLGGDGVILHASNLFRSAVPPVVSFNLGSLGFLTSHIFSTHKQDLQAVIHGHNDMMTGVYITLRMRLRCELYRNGKAVPGKVFDVLNEVVVDRGSNPYLCKIECYERNRLITKVQADGVIIATPTGSTAYSIAAGGSMVHPNVPCMLFTPICPHSLSFRPVILPDSALLELKVPFDARSNAWVSFDGKKRQQLSKGDSVRICMSEHPLPTVNKSDQTDDWFRSLVRCLNWNERLEQRPLSS